MYKNIHIDIYITLFILNCDFSENESPDFTRNATRSLILNLGATSFDGLHTKLSSMSFMSWIRQNSVYEAVRKQTGFVTIIFEIHGNVCSL